MEWHQAFTAKHKKEHVILPIITILIGILLTVFIALMYRHYQESITRSELELNAMTYAEHIRADIVNGIGATTAIEEILISNNGSINRFPEVAEDLRTDVIQSIQLAPDGYVREIYPEEGNEAGKIDLINDPDRGEISRYARDNHVLTMQGPFNLMQGGSGIAVRNPVYLEQADGTETFWGFTIVIIRVPEVFEEAVDGLKGFGYHFRLSKTVAPWDPSYETVTSSDTVPVDAASYEFEIEGSHWKLEVSPADGWYSRFAFFLLLGVGMLIVLLIAGLEYILLVQSDYREMVRHNAELEKALTEAQAANRAKTFFLNNMSHDLRTPLNASLGYTKLLAQLQGMAEKADGHLQKIEESGEHLLSILNNMLDMARMESGEVHLDQEPYLIDPQTPLAGSYAKEMERKHIRFTQKISVQHRHVVLDPWKVGQIYSNLLENAVQYTGEGGTISVTVEELPCEKDGYATYRLSVSDNGIGMGEAFQKHLFESFSRERNTTESKVIGTGLGLAIVKRLVDMMGGTITVESEPGKGSTFHVTLTFQAEEEPEVPAHPEPVQTENPTDVLYGKRILLAEDNALNAEIAIEILEDMGLQTEWAEDGDICVDMLQKADPGFFDLIIMDIQMPNMDGYEATRALSDPGKAGIPIVALTANTFEEDRKKAFAAGMNAHLAKPIDIAKLEETLLSLLRD